VSHPQYERLITQIYFEGDKYNRWDPWWDASLTISLERQVAGDSGQAVYRGVFDIVLSPWSGISPSESP
jgi:protocatechuate 3,4-dioxygenase beta subunit